MGTESKINSIVSRLKSFGWRFLSYIITMALAYLVDNIGLLEISPFYTTFIALILGEVSKWWANKQKELGRSFFGRSIK